VSKERTEQDRNKRKQPEDSSFEIEGLMKGIENLEGLFFSNKHRWALFVEQLNS
jgi:hypothetical protein